jgi:hypothetical protein
MTKKSINKKIFLLDDSNDENETVIWIENKPIKNYFNCGCCKNCLCNDTSSCKNCGCACNCNVFDDYYEIEDTDEDHNNIKK